MDSGSAERARIGTWSIDSGYSRRRCAARSSSNQLLPASISWKSIRSSWVNVGPIGRGSTSSDGTDIADGACSIGDLFATVYRGLGLEPDTKVRDNLGRPLSIAEGKAIKTLV